MASELKGRTLGLILNRALGDFMTTAMYEGHCAGDTQTPVRGVAVCYAPTLDILRRATAEQKNFIVSREHPFFLHGGFSYAYATGGLEAALKDDPVVKAKRDLITAGKLMVYRIGAAWDQFRPKAQSTALAEALGLKPLPAPASDRARGVVCDVPRTTLQSLAQTAASSLKAVTPRVVGDPKSVVTRVAVLAGETDPSPGLARLLADPKIDGVIAGAGGIVDEVDGAVSYFQDVIASGRKISMLAIGYGPSQDPGMAEVARWMKGVLPGMPIEYWPVYDPAWIPR